MKVRLTEGQYGRVLMELFDNTTGLQVTNVDQESGGVVYDVSDGNEINAEVMIQEMHGREMVSIHWHWVKGYENSSPGAWLKMVTYSVKLLREYVMNHRPKLISLLGANPQISRIYNSGSFLGLLERTFSGEYEIIPNPFEGVNERTIYLVGDIETVKNPRVRRIMYDIINYVEHEEDYEI